MSRGLESLFRKAGKLYLAGSVIISPYVLSAGTTVSIEYKHHTINENLDGKGKTEEIYVTTQDTPLPQSTDHNVVVNDTFQILLSYWNSDTNSEVKVPIKTGIDQDVEEMYLKDMNEQDKPENQRKKDLVYVLEYDPDKEDETGYEYARYYHPRVGELSFGSAVLEGEYENIPEK